MKKKRIKWTENTGHAENPQSVRKATDGPQVNMGLIYLCFFFLRNLKLIYLVAKN